MSGVVHAAGPQVALLHDDVCIRFAHSPQRLVLSTPAECDALIAQLVKARTLLEQQEQARSERARLLGTASTASTHVRVFRPTGGTAA